MGFWSSSIWPYTHSHTGNSKWTQWVTKTTKVLGMEILKEVSEQLEDNAYGIDLMKTYFMDV